MLNMDLNENDVVLVRDTRNEKWQTTVFHSYDTTFVGEIRCRDSFDNTWRECIPLKGYENLQNTSLPADGWQQGDLCVFRSSDGMRLGFYLETDDNDLVYISNTPPEHFKRACEDKNVFCVAKDAIRRPETEWPWWDAKLYDEPFCIDKNSVSRIVPV